jgi:hypothetical protein
MGPAGPESASFYIIRGMAFKRILPEKPVFSRRRRWAAASSPGSGRHPVPEEAPANAEAFIRRFTSC